MFGIGRLQIASNIWWFDFNTVSKYHQLFGGFVVHVHMVLQPRGSAKHFQLGIGIVLNKQVGQQSQRHQMGQQGQDSTGCKGGWSYKTRAAIQCNVVSHLNYTSLYLYSSHLLSRLNFCSDDCLQPLLCSWTHWVWPVNGLCWY